MKFNLGFRLCVILGEVCAGTGFFAARLLAAPTAAPRSAAEAPLIRKTARPPNFETPVEALDAVFTPNHLFFERWHLAGIPKVDAATWQLSFGGDAALKPVSFTLSQLKDPALFEQVEINAVAVCSGNRRGLFDPHVPGVQWGHGAMGTARWKGVRLKDILLKVGLKPEALELVFDGADVPVSDGTPDYRKSLPLARAIDETTLIVYAMNGEPLPEAQGFPVRLIVPGWTATYWVKQLVSIEVSTKPFDGFWMKSAYRIPKGAFPAVEAAWPSQSTAVNTPITEVIVNSLITKPLAGISYKRGQHVSIAGFAWDGGHGIEKVEVTTNGGKSWSAAKLGKDHGKYSWRRFVFSYAVPVTGQIAAQSRATNKIGQTQAPTVTPNPAGYHHNVPQGLQPQVAAISSAGDELKLKVAPGHELVAAHCAQCHSLDYIEMNAPVLDHKGWEAEVNKMIKAYGAQISQADALIMVDYLTKNYGR